ncbi:MAG: hypothetical protein ACU0CO_00525 [Shimia sp.]
MGRQITVSEEAYARIEEELRHAPGKTADALIVRALDSLQKERDAWVERELGESLRQARAGETVPAPTVEELFDELRARRERGEV